MLFNLIVRIENNKYISIIRQGFMRAVPFTMIGSFALLLYSFPVAAYQTFLAEFLGGALGEFFHIVYDYTLNMITLILIVTFSLSYRQGMDHGRTGLYTTVALSSYCAFVFVPGETLSMSIFGPQWLFTGMVITFAACALLRLFLNLKTKRLFFHKKINEYQFVTSARTLLSVAFVIGFFAALNLIITNLFNAEYAQNLFSYLAESVFKNLGTNLGSAVLFIALVHLMWMFGIHGNNVLETVASSLFEGGMAVNAGKIAAGLPPTEIFTKTFFDVFVLMGGCGTALCIIAAILIASKNKSRRRLAKAGITTTLFNISEVVVFGLPVIFNPIMLIPFVCVPLVMLLTSTFAVSTGIVPIAGSAVNWTTPVFLSGMLATGSTMGGVLQLVNLALGTVIYIPFIKMLDKPNAKLLQNNVAHLKSMVEESEEIGEQPNLLTGTKQANLAARKLLDDLYGALPNGELSLYYQPQIDHEGRLFGAEGLLRWNHPQCGFIYPPLVINLAKEDGYLDELGFKLIELAASDLQRLVNSGVHNFKMAVNISASQLENDNFSSAVASLLEKHDFGDCKFALELTEREALTITPHIQKTLDELKNANVGLIMDDFGMGHNSLTYMQNNKFSFVKLDGNLVQKLVSNDRSRDIVKTVCELAKRLNFSIIAEFVETEEQKEALHALGCNVYQGYLFSPALPYDEFAEKMVRK